MSVCVQCTIFEHTHTHTHTHIIFTVHLFFCVCIHTSCAATKRPDKADDGDSDDKSSSGRGRPRRKAAKKVSRSAYVMDDKDDVQEYVDSPASEGEVVKGGGGKRGRGRKRKPDDQKVPPIKIKFVKTGRSDGNNSPIFFAQSLDEVGQIVHVCI